MAHGGRGRAVVHAARAGGWPPILQKHEQEEQERYREEEPCFTVNSLPHPYPQHSLQSTLSLLMDVLLSDAHDSPGLCQAAGRLVNALVAVYGPELVPGSAVFYRCKVCGRH